MPCLKLFTNEEARLRALAEYDLANGNFGQSLDHLVEITSRLFDVPMAFISIVEKERQVFQARVGIVACETDRGIAFCSHTIEQEEALVILDAHLDPRFCNNPLSRGEPHIRFYAGVPLRTPSGQALGTLCVADSWPRNQFSAADLQTLKDLARLVMDAFEARRLEVAGKIGQTRFEQIANTSPDGIVCADAEGRITFWNKAAETLFGYSPAQALGQDIELIIPPAMRNQHGSGLKKVARGREPRLIGKTIELPALHQDGTEIFVELSLSTWFEQDEAAFGAIFRDVRERRRNEEKLFKLAYLDPLTQLPNRSVLKQRIAELSAAGRPFSVMMLDLDEFKQVNDSFGHPAGDDILRTAAKRVLECVRPADTVCRMGGDEFAIILTDVRSIDDATAKADKIIALMTEPFNHEEQLLYLGASIGITLCPEDSQEPDELISNADMALYEAKIAGRNRFERYAATLRLHASTARTLRQQLRLAVQREEFELHYQPQVSLTTGQLIGAEALLRWNHPTRGLVYPGDFIGDLERMPDAVGVGWWILNRALQDASRWRGLASPSFRMAVNLFGAQLNAKDLEKEVNSALARANLPASALELEITENISLPSDSDAIPRLQRLKALGVSIAFDDYGTGYASLSLLKQFPITKLKIDRSFIMNMVSSLDDATIIKAILAMGKGLGMSVLAEGIETSAELFQLQRNGCQEGQGYFFGKPIPAIDFERECLGKDFFSNLKRIYC
ncbi:putative bifunctional diguanylate cyclase/phosphodiesterase [Pseudomonas oryzihabitans]|uniref:putative bifunctional diguanylate cyclase/phosphodiesterase n=1 Tax=Pseudomonas oryzihabitans TaxID=47885 RepID=UPI0011A8E980|nr:EAL domain-containing protein [Pseudomonas psychrotolerans]